MSPDKCVILVPVGHHIEAGCEQGLRELERRGYTTRRVYGYSAIDLARSQMASDALADGFEELMWIDADIVFDPDDVEKLRRCNTPVVAGLYAKKGRRELAHTFLRETETIELGTNGGLMEIQFAGFGFTLTHRIAYDRMFERLGLPICNQRFEKTLVPFFAPSAVKDGGQGWWYLAEDYSFCMRCRAVGIPVMADTRIRLWHVGNYNYSWEDAGGAKERYRGYTFRVREPGAKFEDLPPDAPLFHGVSIDTKK